MNRIAVITPYCKEALPFLAKCHESVGAQSHACRHVLVADGYPREEIDGWDVDHIRLPYPHDDVGSTPRLIGCVHAIGCGYDALAFLDADNWYHERHIENLAGLLEQGADFAASGRYLCRPDGTLIGACPHNNSATFVDTSCMMFGRRAFPLLHHWVLMPDYGHVIGDRILYYHVRKSGLNIGIHQEATLFYRARKPGLYRELGLEPPAECTTAPDYPHAFRRWEEDGNPSLLRP